MDYSTKNIKNWENRAWGYPLGGKRLELAAKMAQDASKRGFQEALEASWGRLGRPKRELI